MEYQLPAAIAKDLLVALVEKEGVIVPRLDEDDCPDGITQAKILGEMYKILFRDINRSFQPPKRSLVE
mgnify:CR=1 FL=1